MFLILEVVNMFSEDNKANFKHVGNKKFTVTDDKCALCNGKEIIYDSYRGEFICTCGLVLGKVFEQQNISNYDYLTNFLCKHISNTIISNGCYDFFGNKIPLKKRQKFYRLKKLQRISLILSSKEKSINKGIYELNSLASRIGITKKVKDTAFLIYIKAIRDNYLRGRAIECCIPACIYAACRMRRNPRSLSEVSGHSKLTKKELGKSYKKLVKNLNLNIPIANPYDYLSRITSSLGMTTIAYIKAYEIIKLAKEENLTISRDPNGIAAAAVYISGLLQKEKRYQETISRVSNVPVITLRTNYKLIIKKLKIKKDD